MNIKGIRGLYTANPLEAPEGSCSRAKNVWMRDKGVLEPRPGFGRDSTALTIAGASRLVPYKSNQSVVALGTSQAQEVASGTPGTARTMPPAGVTVAAGLVVAENYGSDLILGFKSAVAASSIGSIYSWEENNFLGYVRCLGARLYSTSADYDGGQSTCGYRYVLGRNLSSGRVVLSAPSGVDKVVQDTTPAGNLTRRVYLHDSAVAGDFIQMYRTKMVTVSAGPDISLPVGSSFYLCKEQALIAQNISDGYVGMVDATPDGALGPPLYTNPHDGEGELGANEMPPRTPIAGCVWDDRLWVMNGGVGFGDLQLQLLGTGTGSNALADGDTITIGGVVFTAKNTPTTTQHFQLYRSGGLADIWITAQLLVHATSVALVNAVNNYFGASVMALLDGDNTAGAMAVVSDTVTMSKQACWAPVSGSEFTNTPPPGTFRVRFSKPGQPDAFRIDHFIDLGPGAIEGETCQRMVSQENRILIFMSMSGVWEISGEFPYQVRRANPGIRVLNSRCAIAHTDSIYAFTFDGRLVSMVGKSGFMRLAGGAIAPNLLLAANLSSSGGSPFLSSNGTEHRLGLWAIGGDKGAVVADDANIFGAYILNSEHDAWMTWELDTDYAVLDACEEVLNDVDDPGGEGLLLKRYSDSSYFVYRSRNNSADDVGYIAKNPNGDSFLVHQSNADDHADAVTVGVTSQSTAGALSGTGKANLEAGDSVLLEEKSSALVSEVNGNTLALSRESQFTGSGVSGLAYKPFHVSVMMSGADGGESRIRFRDVAAKFGDVYSKGTLKIYAHSDLSTDEAGQAYETFGHGRGAWGSSAWGDKRPSVITVRRYVPQNSSDASVLYAGLEMNEAFGYFRLLGWSITGDKVSERTGR